MLGFEVGEDLVSVQGGFEMQGAAEKREESKGEERSSHGND